MIGLGRDILGWATQVPTIKDTIVSMGWADEERLYLNTTGARCYQRVTRVRGSVARWRSSSGKVEFDFMGGGRIGGVERLDFLTEAKVKEAAESARELLTASAPPTGP